MRISTEFSYTPAINTVLHIGGVVVVHHLLRVEERRSHEDQPTGVSLLKNVGESEGSNQKKVRTVRE